MPLVEVSYRDPLTIESLRLNILAGIVARALDTSRDGDGEQASLIPDDIEVRPRVISQDEITNFDLEVVIFANDFPVRRATRDARRARIVYQYKEVVPPGIRGYVWLLICPASFEEFKT